jgi:hypothetical protein
LICPDEEIKSQNKKIESVDQVIRIQDISRDYVELVTFAIEDSSKIINYNQIIKKLDGVIDSLENIKKKEQEILGSMKFESYKSWFKVFE